MSTVRANTWSVTINNPIAADEENINLARQKGWKVEGQLEKGKNGTPHYQLMVKTPQVRFSAVHKQFPRAHIEVARNVAALANYVQKEETRVADLSSDQELYPSLNKVWSMFADWIDSCDLRSRRYFTWTCDQWLENFDSFIEDKILEGYRVESIAVNPSTRSIVKKFGSAIYHRSSKENKLGECPQTEDRQTDEENVQEVDITDVNDSESIPSACASPYFPSSSSVSEEEVSSKVFKRSRFRR